MEVRNQRKDSQEIDNSVLVVGMYNQDSCIPVANLFIFKFAIWMY